jgi:integrase
MGRRARGSVYPDKERGGWIGALSIGRDPATGRRIRRKVSAATEAECWDLLDEMRAEKRATGTVTRRDATVKTAVQNLLDHPPASWHSPVTIRLNRQHAQRVIDRLGGIRVKGLTAADVDIRLLDWMAARGYARKTIEGTRELLVMALHRAERDGLVLRNVARLAEMPQAPRRESQAMTRAQVRQLLSSDLGVFWRAYIVVGLMCGLRPGELLGLLWADVDLDDGLIRVRHGVDGPHLAELKTPSSRLASHIERFPAVTVTLPWQTPDGHPETVPLLFTSTAGTALQRSDQVTSGNLNGALLQRSDFNHRLWKPALAAAGIPATRPNGYHVLRHSFASSLLHDGCDIRAVAEYLGHSDPGFTLKTYCHLMPDAGERMRSVVDRALTGGAPDVRHHHG